MTVSKNIDLLVRVGVLEKLVDRLENKISALETKLVIGSTIQNPSATEDEWEINNEIGTVEKKVVQTELPKDDVSNLLDS